MEAAVTAAPNRTKTQHLQNTADGGGKVFCDEVIIFFAKSTSELLTWNVSCEYVVNVTNESHRFLTFPSSLFSSLAGSHLHVRQAFDKLGLQIKVQVEVAGCVAQAMSNSSSKYSFM